MNPVIVAAAFVGQAVIGWAIILYDRKGQSE